MACANVASLLLARATTRDREMGVRASLGAGPGRLVRQLLAESLLLALAGGLLGVVLAAWSVDLFRHLAPPTLPRLAEIGVGGHPLALAGAVALLASLLAGVAPAVHAWRVDFNEVLKQGRGSGVRRHSVRVRAVLAASQLSLALVLLAASGLLVRSLVNLSAWQPGFDWRRVITVQVFAPPAKYPDSRGVADLYTRAVADLRTLPSVISATAASARSNASATERGALSGSVTCTVIDFMRACPRDDGGGFR